MSTTTTARIDPWRIEILVVRGGSHTDGERSALRRDEQRGALTRLAHGAYADRTAFGSLGPEDQHVVRMRAMAAVTDARPVFSHWSAAVLHGLPVLRERLRTVHVSFDAPGSRSGGGVTGHVFPLQQRELVGFQELRATGVGRTVVDVAGAAPFEEGVMAADGALRAGVPRGLLDRAADLAGPRRAGRRIEEVLGFGHPGSESAAESRFRVTAMRLGLEPPVLQFPITLADGSMVHLDALLERLRVGVEVDGDRKYLEAEMAPNGAARAVIAEKRREDEMRTHLLGLARIGWVQAGSTTQLRAVLARVGVQPPRRRSALADYVAAAHAAHPRFPPGTPRWRA